MQQFITSTHTFKKKDFRFHASTAETQVENRDVPMLCEKIPHYNRFILNTGRLTMKVAMRGTN